MRVDAIERWSDELARNPASLAFLPLAEELRRRHRLEEARRVALLGLERHPYRPDAHDLLARIWVDLGDDQRARDEWEMALELDHAHLSSLKGLGFLAYRRRDLAGAERLLRAARARDPNDSGLEAALRRVHEALRGGTGDHRNGVWNAAGGAPGHGSASGQTSGQTNGQANGQTSGKANGQDNGHVNGHVNGHAKHAAAAEGDADRAFARLDSAGSSGTAGVAGSELRGGARTRTLFAPVLGEGEGAALLLDRDGLVLAGTYVDATGADVAEAVGAELAGVGEEAARALGHLGLGTWEALLVEAEQATVALGPAGEGALVLVAGGSDAQVGFVRRLLDRACRRAAAWLEAS